MGSFTEEISHLWILKIILITSSIITKFLTRGSRHSSNYKRRQIYLRNCIPGVHAIWSYSGCHLLYRKKIFWGSGWIMFPVSRFFTHLGLPTTCEYWHNHGKGMFEHHLPSHFSYWWHLCHITVALHMKVMVISSWTAFSTNMTWCWLHSRQTSKELKHVMKFLI